MSKLFKLALEEYTPEEIIDDTSLDEISNPDTAADMSDIETATEEINECKEEIYKYVVAMEEASNTVDAIYSQIDRNNQLIAQGDVSTVDVTIATEAIHNIADNIGWDGLNGINLSTEGYGSNIDKLKIANEAGEGMISSIIKAIKDFFIKIINMVKKLYIKFMSWINLYDKKLQGLKKDFHNVLYKGNILIDSKLFIDIAKLFPFIASKQIEDTSLKDLLTNRFQIAKWVEHLNPKNLDKTIDEVVNGTFAEKHKDIPYIDSVYDVLSKDIEKSGNKEVIALITSFRGGTVNYISGTKTQDGKLKLGEIATRSYSIEGQDKVTTSTVNSEPNAASITFCGQTFKITDTTINKNDFSDLVDYTSKNLTSGLKDFNNNILKLQEKCKEKLDKMTGADATDEIKANLKTIQYLGGRVSVDMCLSIFDIIRRYIKAMVTIHSECVSQMPNFRLLQQLYEKHGMKATIRFMDPIAKKHPYMDCPEVTDLVAKSMGVMPFMLGGFCIPNDESIRKGGITAQDKAAKEYVEECEKKGMDPDSIVNIIHMNNNLPRIAILGKWIYWHEMGHAVLDQKENLSQEVWTTYAELQKGISINQARGIYETYTKSPVEIQADAFAAAMTGATWKDVFYGLSKFLPTGYALVGRQAGLSKEQIEKDAKVYEIEFKKATEVARPWANAGCLARLKSWIKGNR